MSHIHLEIVLPPMETVAIPDAVAQVMKPFDENGEDPKHSFWYFYVIGGRWAGHKAMAGLDQARVDEFRELLIKQGVTVSGLQFGKQELNPASQIPMVDAMWNEWFPSKDGAFSRCPLFKHSNDQYAKAGPLTGCIDGDIATVGESADVQCEHIIIAHRGFERVGNDNYAYIGPFEAGTMWQRSIWNGVSHVDSSWTGLIRDAVKHHNGNLERASDDCRKATFVTSDWLCVTVDYHT